MVLLHTHHFSSAMVSEISVRTVWWWVLSQKFLIS